MTQLVKEKGLDTRLSKSRASGQGQRHKRPLKQLGRGSDVKTAKRPKTRPDTWLLKLHMGGQDVMK